MTREEDIWECQECGRLQGRHDMWFDGICEECNTAKESEESEEED